jgi:hypothetical protein
MRLKYMGRRVFDNPNQKRMENKANIIMDIMRNHLT